MPASQSYCRHENTLQELRQVYELWDEDNYGEDLIDTEKQARGHLEDIIVELAKSINAGRASAALYE